MTSERFFDRLYELKDGDDVRRHYDRFAADYDRELTSRGYAQPRRVAETLIAVGVPATARILDAGCGSGLSGRALADHGYRNLSGCDYSSEMLALAATTEVYQTLHVVDLNATPVVVPGAPFDAITAVGVIGHGHVSGDAIAELVALLQPGGYLVMGINELAWPDGEVKDSLDALVADSTVTPYIAEVGEHIPGLGSQGWVVCTSRP